MNSPVLITSHEIQSARKRPLLSTGGTSKIHRKLFCFCVYAMKPVNTNTYKFLFCYIFHFHLSNYGAEPLLSLIFHKTVTKISLCHKYELFLTQNKENITLNHNEERITIILGSIWSKDLCSHTYSACNPRTQLAKLLFSRYTKMAPR